MRTNADMNADMNADKKRMRTNADKFLNADKRGQTRTKFEIVAGFDSGE